MIYNKGCLLIVFVFITGKLFAQEPYFKKYTVDDGFPATTAYKILQDKNNFLWFCTGAVCCFDGKNVRTFGPQNSIADYGIFYLFRDSKDRIWTISTASSPLYYENNKFHMLPDTLQEKLAYARWMFEDGKGQLYFINGNNLVRVNSNWEHDILPLPLSASHGEMINDTSLIVSGVNGIYRVNNFSIIQKLPIQAFDNTFNRCFKVKANMAIGYGKEGLYQFTSEGFKQIWKNAPWSSPIFYCLHTENDSTFWMGTRDGLYIFRYKNNKLELLKKHLANKEILSIFKDKNGNYWIGSVGDAIYLLNASGNNYFQLPEGQNNVQNIFFLGEKGYVFNNKGGCFRLKNDRLNKIYNPLAENPTLGYLSSERLSENSVLAMFNGGNYAILQNDNIKIKNRPFGLQFLNCYFRVDKKLFIAGRPDDNTIDIYQGENDVKKQIKQFKGRYNMSGPFCVDFNNRIWYQYKDTLFCLETIPNGTIRRKFINKGIRFYDIRCDRENKIWVATNGAGIFCFKDKKFFANYTTDSGLTTNFCTAIYIDENNNVWASSKNGLNKIHQDRNGKTVITAFTTGNLLPSNVVNCVYKKDNTVYVGTAGGLFSFKDENSKTINAPVYCYITQIEAGGVTKDATDSLICDYNTPLNIGFSAIAFNQAMKPVYHYKLEGADDTWNTTTSEQVQYGRLKPGNYTFKVYANDNFKNQLLLSIMVLPPFWLQWWFIALAVLAALAAIVAIISFIIQSRHKKAELKRRMIENDLNSLRAQINPHFIFNALNSIQDFILDQQPRVANHYLSQFARLMRMIVDNSKRDFINLQDEKAFLQLYIELERLRIDSSLSFEIIVDKTLDTTETCIPPMIIQPVIENALKHGLAGKKGEKKLQVKFIADGDILRCMIQDNGVGREYTKSLAGKRLSRQSTGILNISERLQLLYKKLDIKGETVKITDLYNNGNPEGTLVELFIPLIYKFDNAKMTPQ
jgi:two-component sensor histidine kinase